MVKQTWQGSNFMYVKREKCLPVAFQVWSQICPVLLPASAKAWVPKPWENTKERKVIVAGRILTARTAPGSWCPHT